MIKLAIGQTLLCIIEQGNIDRIKDEDMPLLLDLDDPDLKGRGTRVRKIAIIYTPNMTFVSDAISEVMAGKSHLLDMETLSRILEAARRNADTN